MTGRRGPARAAAIAVSVGIHLGLLAALASQAPRLAERFEPPMSVEIIPVFVTPRTERPMAPRAAALPARRHGEESAEAPVATAAAAPAETNGVAPAVITPGLRAALRRQMGCAERSGVRLAKDEREGCDEQFGKGALAAPYLKAPIAPEIRQYWDAVAEAKSNADLPTAPIARQRLGVRAAPGANMKGHGPGLGCHIGFGRGGMKVFHPPHGLKLGPLPCFIVPPAGSLSPDVDVQNPDEVVKDRP